MSVLPGNRIPEILRRMDVNSSQAEAMKTCFGILAIMSREDANKSVIAKEGMEIMLNAMTIHIDRTDVQEAGCDLLWSLAFNSTPVKETIAKYNGAIVLVRALKRHSRSPEFLKSACGALSNLCQYRANQEAVAYQGGLQPLVGSIHVHQSNAKLLPFIFDAIASIIVNNEDNARSVSALGMIPVVVAALDRHRQQKEVVKSGCHALAILSDVKGHASKVAFAGGVAVILALLDLHPLYADLHRVAAVVLLRMLQESSHVAREICVHEGLRILLVSLAQGGAQQDTVAALTHILYTATNANATANLPIENQLWIHDSNAHAAEGDNRETHDPTSGNNGERRCVLGVVLRILREYQGRRDVIRASCRLIMNLVSLLDSVLFFLFTNDSHTHTHTQTQTAAQAEPHTLDSLFVCANTHRDAKDVLETCSLVTRLLVRRNKVPVILAHTTQNTHTATESSESESRACLEGVVHVLTVKGQGGDEEVLLAFLELVHAYFDRLRATYTQTHTASRLSDELVQWCHRIITFYMAILEKPNRSISPRLQQRVVRFLESVERESGFFLATQYSNAYSNTEAAVRLLVRAAQPEVSGTEMQRRESERETDRERLRGTHDAHESTPNHANSHASLLPAVVQQGSAGGVGGSSVRERETALFGRPSVSVSGTACAVRERDRASVSVSVSQQQHTTTTTATSVSVRRERDTLKDREREAARSQYAHLTAHAHHYEGPGGRLFPRHPYVDAQGEPQRLLCAWPHHLERLLCAPAFTSNINTAAGFLSPPLPTQLDSSGMANNSTTTRAQIVYESTRPGGRTVLQKQPCSLPQNATPVMCGSERDSLNVSGSTRDTEKDRFEHSLTFDSEFESGNLQRAVQIAENRYELFLRPDVHTQGHTQWFYFSVANTHPAELVRLYEQGVCVPAVRIHFQIVNFTKPDSLFNLGMRPVLYSLYDAQNKGAGWVRGGSDIHYAANSYIRPNPSAGEGNTVYYTLSFTIEFTNPKDTVFIAYSYPYTLTDYRLDIEALLRRPKADKVIKRFKLCETLAGEACDLLVITDFTADKDRIGTLVFSDNNSSNNNINNNNNMESDSSNRYPTSGYYSSGYTTGYSSSQFMAAEESNSGKLSVRSSSRRSNFTASHSYSNMSNGSGAGSNGDTNGPLKPALFFSGRVHPGETPASWMMKGMLDFLTGDTTAARLLRQMFVVFIVPILNPDGVVHGNNRCSLAGVDLNRQWKTPSRTLHPTIYALKSVMLAQRRQREIAMYIDLHGHSRKYNVFMYGCDEKKNRPRQSLSIRAFPRLFSQHPVGGKYLCFEDCSFHIKKGRESTARVVVAKELNIPLSFTLEATFCGANYGPLKNCHMNVGHLQEVGASLCDAVLQFCVSEGYAKDLGAIVAPPTRNFALTSSSPSTTPQTNTGTHTDTPTGMSSFEKEREKRVENDLEKLRAQAQQSRSLSATIPEEEERENERENDAEEVDSDSADDGEGDRDEDGENDNIIDRTASLEADEEGISLSASAKRVYLQKTPSGLSVPVDEHDSRTQPGPRTLTLTLSSSYQQQQLTQTQTQSRAASNKSKSGGAPKSSEVLESLSVRTFQEFEKMKTAALSSSVVVVSNEKTSLKILRKSSDSGTGLLQEGETGEVFPSSSTKSKKERARSKSTTSTSKKLSGGSRSAGSSNAIELSGTRIGGDILPSSDKWAEKERDRDSKKGSSRRESSRGSGSTIVKGEFSDLFFAQPKGIALTADLAKDTAVATSFGLPKMQK